MSADVDRSSPYVERLEALLGSTDPLDVLTETPRALGRVVQGVAPELFERAEGPGRWSLADLARHLADTEIAYGFRLRTALTVETPHFPAFPENVWVDRFRDEPLEDALQRLDVLRRSHLAVIARIRPSELERVGVHSERGVETVRRMVRLWAGHDLVHLAQGVRIRDALESAAAGPS